MPFGRKRQGWLNPVFDSVSTMEQSLIDLFNDDFFNDAFSLSKNRTNSLPKINIKETKDKFVIEAAIPGFTADDISIEAYDNKLYISGNVKDKRSDEEDDYIFKEVSFRKFNRVIPLPSQIDTDTSIVDYDKGLLYITLPKKRASEKKRGKKLKVRSGT